MANYYSFLRAVLLAMLTIPLGACMLMTWATLPSFPGLPKCVPFAVAEPHQQTSFNIEIVNEYRYDFELSFYFLNDSSYVDVQHLQRLLKDPPAGERVPFYVRVTVVRTDLAEPQMVFNTEKEPKSWPGAQRGRIWQAITYSFLPPGHYRVTVDSLQGAPAFAGRVVDFCMTYRIV